ncbi:hypothetical protein EPI10_028402 [Gossypium australe]|uniref:Uncharacterized protein n=1 Tax=Gossypium australe TaxID=47621 RepID=A0A5B6UWL0_9ROSI|nr:hypothetical protein EPI10_028402 [Gossypium australe]
MGIRLCGHQTWTNALVVEVGELAWCKLGVTAIIAHVPGTFSLYFLVDFKFQSPLYWQVIEKRLRLEDNARSAPIWL